MLLSLLSQDFWQLQLRDRLYNNISIKSEKSIAETASQPHLLWDKRQLGQYRYLLDLSNELKEIQPRRLL